MQTKIENNKIDFVLLLFVTVVVSDIALLIAALTMASINIVVTLLCFVLIFFSLFVIEIN